MSPRRHRAQHAGRHPQHAGCAYAKNLVADAIRDIVTGTARATRTPEVHRHRRRRPRDPVLPLPRHRRPRPRVDLRAAGAATLRLAGVSLQANHVLSQDAYGSLDDAPPQGRRPARPRPAGRTPGRDAERDRRRCSTRTCGLERRVVPTPTSSLVTGYDFMASGAKLGRGRPQRRARRRRDERHADHARRDTATRASPGRRASCSTALLGSRHDLIYLGGHFSANNTLAADFSTTLDSTDLRRVDRQPDELDRLQRGLPLRLHHRQRRRGAERDAAARLDARRSPSSGATLIAGTGYQYGDTDFLAYSEKLYADFAHALRYGSGPVAVGNALVQAKNRLPRRATRACRGSTSSRCSSRRSTACRC